MNYRVIHTFSENVKTSKSKTFNLLKNKWTDLTSILIAFFIYFKILLLIRTAIHLFNSNLFLKHTMCFRNSLRHSVSVIQICNSNEFHRQ